MSKKSVIRFVLLLLSCSPAFGSHWVSEFRGSAAEYRIIRANRIVPLQQLMALDTGDTIFVDDPGGQILIIDDHDEHLRLTQENTPFVVPNSASPPRLLKNVRDWITSWWNTRDGQSTSTMAAISKGGLEPEISIATSGKNYLLQGERELHIAWSGGIEPFHVTIAETSGAVLAELTGVAGSSVSLPCIELVEGEYVLRVSAGGAASSVAISVVGAEALPAPANEILTVEIPDKIRFGHVAMLLSAYSDWRFEALQVAKKYKLQQVVLDLMVGNFPESDISEHPYSGGDSDSEQSASPNGK